MTARIACSTKGDANNALNCEGLTCLAELLRNSHLASTRKQTGSGENEEIWIRVAWAVQTHPALEKDRETCQLPEKGFGFRIALLTVVFPKDWKALNIEVR